MSLLPGTSRSHPNVATSISHLKWYAHQHGFVVVESETDGPNPEAIVALRLKGVPDERSWLISEQSPDGVEIAAWRLVTTLEVLGVDVLMPKEDPDAS